MADAAEDPRSTGRRRVLGIDVGNSRVKIHELPAGPSAGEPRLVDRPPIVTPLDDAERILDLGLAEGPVGRLHLVCVRPDLGSALVRAARARGLEVRHWTAAELPMEHPYADPSRLGPDRLLAAWAARGSVGAPCIVLDAGTALTVDLVDAGGRFAGGAIAPGLTLASRALRGGAMLEEARPVFPLDYPGRDTAGALAAGALAAVIGAARQLVDEARRALGTDGARAPLVATGGDAAPILAAAGETLGPHDLDPRLLERGLARLEAGA